MLSPSLMCADLLNLERDIRILERSGVELFHVDVMDGHFVRNFGLPYDVIRAVKGITFVPLDVHLAVDNPDVHAPLACGAGADIVTFHPEATGDVPGLIGMIHARGRRACLAVSPDLSLEALDPALTSPANRPDFLNLLMVRPGFAGQAMIPSTKEKLERLKVKLRSQALSNARSLVTAVPVMVDGNVSPENIPWMVEHGADVLILGTSGLFKKGANLEEGIVFVRELVERALRGA
jgi:ribulose-phosphate 3-epimerase